MNTKRLIAMVLGMALGLGIAGQAQAVSMTYNVVGSFNDGGSLLGTLDIDSSAGWVGNITNWNLTTSGGSSGISGFTYNLSTSAVLLNTAALTITSTLTTTGSLMASRSLSFSGYSPTLNNPGPYSIGSIFENVRVGFSSTSRIGSGSGVSPVSGSGVSSVPEPTSLLLLGSGLAGLGAWRYRKTKTA